MTSCNVGGLGSCSTKATYGGGDGSEERREGDAFRCGSRNAAGGGLTPFGAAGSPTSEALSSRLPALYILPDDAAGAAAGIASEQASAATDWDTDWDTHWVSEWTCQLGLRGSLWDTLAAKGSLPPSVTQQRRSLHSTASLHLLQVVDAIASPESLGRASCPDEPGECSESLRFSSG